MAFVPHIRARIAAWRDTTHNTRVFRLHPLVGGYAFQPGQHCLLDAGIGRPRPFSFTSVPSDGPGFELAIKRVGVLTQKLFQLRVGDIVTISQPLPSRFTFRPDDSRVVMVAGGTGVTPFVSLLRDATAQHLPTRLTLVFSNTTEADIIYRDELRALAGANPRLRVVLTLSHAWPQDWGGERGLIDAAMISRHVGNLREPRWMLCGPPRMVVAIKKALVGLGVPAERIVV